MPTVVRFNRCRIAMYFGDHPPPHFHVITVAGEEAIHLIDTLALWAGSADPRDTLEALTWAAKHREELWARWKQYCEQEESEKP